MRMVDAYGSSILMTMVVDSYYIFFGNQCTPYDVEIEFRKQGLNVGLIAIEWVKHPFYRKMIENEGDRVIMRKNYKQSIEQAKYLTIIVCKNRRDVIAETLSYHNSIDDNLRNLKESGEMLSHLTNKYDDFYSAIQQGALLMQINQYSYQNIFERITQTNPTAQLIQAKPDLIVVVKDGIIISPIALQVEENEIRYVLIGIKK